MIRTMTTRLSESPATPIDLTLQFTVFSSPATIVMYDPDEYRSRHSAFCHKCRRTLRNLGRGHRTVSNPDMQVDILMVLH